MTHHTRWRGIARAFGYSSADCRWISWWVRSYSLSTLPRLSPNRRAARSLILECDANLTVGGDENG